MGCHGSRGMACASIMAIVAAAGAFATSARAQSLTALPLRQGEITFAMRATKVNDFVGRVTALRAEYSGGDLGTVRGNLELRVADMHTGIGLRDRHMRNAMRADSFPTIRFELVGVDAGGTRGDTVSVVFQGHLTIHGATKTVRVPGTVVMRQGGVDVSASIQIDMREYGIDPPTRFLGAIRVLPVTAVTANLSFGGPEGR